jgi:DNA-binding MarR family transcriptional regulator
MTTTKKELFAPIPVRAMNDLRLSPRHFRALMAVAFHDRFGRNGQGCWVGRKQLAKEAGCDETNFSHALSDLRLFGYIKSEEHPLSRRMKVHRVIYDTAERCEAQHLSTDVRCETRHPSEENRCQKTPEQVLSESAKTLNGADNSSVNILIDNTDILRRDCAEARQPRKQGQTIESAESYLSDVEASLSDPDSTIRLAARFECPRLSNIVDDDALPEQVRTRAARLRDIARDAA